MEPERHVRHHSTSPIRSAHGDGAGLPYYMLLPVESGRALDRGTQAISLTCENTTIMTAYWADLRLFFQRAAGSSPVVLHMEPDMWGYIEQAATNDDASTVPAKVAAHSGSRGLAGLPDTAAGFAQADRPPARRPRPERRPRVPPLLLGDEDRSPHLADDRRPDRRARGAGGPLLHFARSLVRRRVHRASPTVTPRSSRSSTAMAAHRGGTRRTSRASRASSGGSPPRPANGQ